MSYMPLIEPMKSQNSNIDSIVNSPVYDKIEPLNANNPMEILNNQSGRSSLLSMIDKGLYVSGISLIGIGVFADGFTSVASYVIGGTAIVGAVAPRAVDYIYTRLNPSTTVDNQEPQ